MCLQSLFHRTALEQCEVLAEAIVKNFTEADLTSFHEKSYSLAESYLTKNVAKQWQQLIEELQHA